MTLRATADSRTSLSTLGITVIKTTAGDYLELAQTNGRPAADRLDEIVAAVRLALGAAGRGKAVNQSKRRPT